MNLQPTRLWKNSLWVCSSYGDFLSPRFAAPGALPAATSLPPSRPHCFEFVSVLHQQQEVKWNCECVPKEGEQELVAHLAVPIASTSLVLTGKGTSFTDPLKDPNRCIAITLRADQHCKMKAKRALLCPGVRLGAPRPRAHCCSHFSQNKEIRVGSRKSHVWP